MGTIQLLLGRHGPGDHYLGGRFRRRDRPRRSPSLAFPLGPETIHLFEFLTPSQLREPVIPRRMFPNIGSRYEITAVGFAQKVEVAGGKTFNAESRPSAEMDARYAALHEAAQQADLKFFKRPLYEVFLAVSEVEEEFMTLRENLIEANLEHFASQGHNVVARLGRIHSAVRRLARRGFVVRTQTGAGSFFPEQILKRRAAFGLGIREEDRMRAYADRFLRIVPSWHRGFELPPHERLLALRGRDLESVAQRFDEAARASRSLPELRDLLAILDEVTPP